MDMRNEAAPFYFYELHEGDDEVFSDVLLAHATEFDEAQFLELVLESRARVVDTFETDSLSEAIAADLREQHGFLVIDDSQLRVAVIVSTEEGGTLVADIDERSAQPAGEPDDFRSVLLDVDPEDRLWGDA